MRKFSLYIMLCIFFGLLTGCATTQNLSPENRATVHTIFVDPTVTLPKEVFYFGVGQNLAFMGGGMAGALLAGPSAEKTGEQIRTVLATNHIDVSRMATSEFASQLRNTGRFAITSNPRQADAILKLEIVAFGLYEKAPLSSELRPIMAMSATLTNRNNEVIWKDEEQVTVFTSPADTYNLKDFLSRPMLLKEGFGKTISANVTKLLTSLNR